LLFGKKVSKKSLKETAVFCADLSKAKKAGKRKIEVHGFNPEDVYKTPRMKTGTFGIKRISWKYIVKVKAKG
jgi:predicted ribosome quality control (RQC) complex YloA/Tae2 family protein